MYITRKSNKAVLKPLFIVKLNQLTAISLLKNFKQVTIHNFRVQYWLNLVCDLSLTLL